jgi:hypothetical protein
MSRNQTEGGAKMERIDEMTNEELARKGHSEAWIREERRRVEDIIKRHVTTGADLSHWFERDKILNTLLHENSRSVHLA